MFGGKFNGIANLIAKKQGKPATPNSPLAAAAQAIAQRQSITEPTPKPPLPSPDSNPDSRMYAAIDRYWPNQQSPTSVPQPTPILRPMPQPNPPQVRPMPQPRPPMPRPPNYRPPYMGGLIPRPRPPSFGGRLPRPIDDSSPTTFDNIRKLLGK
jgi:hypothetical protein